MQDASLGMGVSQRGAELPHPGSGFLEAVAVLGPVNPQRRQGPAVHILHGNRRQAVVLDEVVGADDLRVGELEVATGLGFESRDGAGVRQERFREDL